MKLRPLKLKPALRTYIWGGTKLKEFWGKESDTDSIAECWELSMYTDSESIVDDPAFYEYTLSKLQRNYPELFGDKVNDYSKFPILIKLLDASADLSIQVHPDDVYAMAREGGQLGKNEVWYIADAEEGAAIYYGFNRDVTKEEVIDGVVNGTITELLNRCPVKKGDCFFVPAGTVHALQKGVTVIEVQQSSDITYRLYDYGRKDKNGNARKLHIREALDVMTLKKSEIPTLNPQKELANGAKLRILTKNGYFTAKEVVIEKGEYLIYSEESFVTFTVADGEAEFESGEKIKKGDTWFIPAYYMAKIKAEKATLVVTTI
ncbi:MAG: class I mannose-6-phosphate isomerase [Clostridia bacterium]|nr:class I mannose-6-phosphate isomerase [Clostridia bacterium]